MNARHGSGFLNLGFDASRNIIQATQTKNKLQRFTLRQAQGERDKKDYFVASKIGTDLFFSGFQTPKQTEQWLSDLKIQIEAGAVDNTVRPYDF